MIRPLVLPCLVVLLFGPVLWVLGPRSDYAVHVGEAAYWLEHGTTRIPLPNFLFAALTIAVKTLLPWLSPLSAGLLVGLLAYLGLAATLRRLLERSLSDSPGARSELTALGLALSLVVLMPINLFTLPERNLYFGYVPLASYHNPTSILLKPLALLLLLQIVRGLRPRRRAPVPHVASAALLSALATLAKPSYTIALLPALALLLPGLQVASSRSPGPGNPKPDWRLLLWGVGAPAVAVLAWQYAYTYSAGQATHATLVPSGIAWAPFRVVGMLSPSGGLAKFALSIAFPVCVAAAYFRRVRGCPTLVLCWLCFGIGAFYMYFLAETGPRLRDANFIWSAQITLFLLFVASLRFLLGQLSRDAPGPGLERRAWLCFGVYGLHLVSGLVWYVLQTLHFAVPSVPILKHWF